MLLIALIISDCHFIHAIHSGLYDTHLFHLAHSQPLKFIPCLNDVKVRNIITPILKIIVAD